MIALSSCDTRNRAILWLPPCVRPRLLCLRFLIAILQSVLVQHTDRSGVRLSAGSYQDFANWYCSLLTRRKVCGRAAENTPRTQNKPSEMKPEIVSVVALHDHCSNKAPTTNHHSKKKLVQHARPRKHSIS